MPDVFSFDISANSLKKLWLAVGWTPMYSYDDERSMLIRNTDFPANYACGEVLGPEDLLRIKSINGQRVGAEVGMTVQLVGSFYPPHFYNPQEVYYSISKSKCLDDMKNFLIEEGHENLKLLKEDKEYRYVQW